MLTWRLLRSVLIPSYSRIGVRLRQMERFYTAAPSLRFTFKRNGAYHLFRLIALIVVPALFLMFVGPILIITGLFTLIHATVMLPIIENGVGAAVVSGIAGLIAAEHERRTYDLLSVIPSGRMGVHLGYCRHWVGRNAGVLKPILLTALFLGIWSLILGLGPEEFFWLSPMQSSLAERLLLSVVLIVDMAQTVVLAGMIGMGMPALITTRLNAIYSGLAGFAAIQLSIYAAFLLISGVIVPLLFDPSHQIAGILIVAIASLVVREAVIGVIWRWITMELSASLVDLDPAAGVGV